MRVTELADYRLRYFSNERECYLEDEHMANVREWQEARNQRWNEGRRKEAAEFGQYCIEKPDWFMSAERSARGFVKGLGMAAARGTQISLLQVDDPEAEMEIFGAPHVKKLVDAYYLPHLGIAVRNSYAELAYSAKGKLAIGQLLVHELVHSAEARQKTISYIYNPETKKWGMQYRQGFTLSLADKKSKHHRGEFFTEGTAEYISGLYIRSKVDKENTYFDEKAVKSNRLPSHYATYRPDKGYPYTSGPDGFALEIVAATLERRGIVPAEAYARSILATYSEDYQTRLQGFRDFARYTNQVRPGLYTELQKLKYSRRSWINGLRLVIDAAQAE